MSIQRFHSKIQLLLKLLLCRKHSHRYSNIHMRLVVKTLHMLIRAWNIAAGILQSCNGLQLLLEESKNTSLIFGCCMEYAIACRAL